MYWKYLITVILLPVVCQVALAGDYTIRFDANKQEVATFQLSIKNGQATTNLGGDIALFDLKQKRWQNEESGQWSSLKDCETWAHQSKDKTAASAATVPPQMRRFVDWTLDPTFTIEEQGNVIRFTSGVVDYVIAVRKANSDMADYFTYARLNAYKKAMTERKLPPYAELKVLAELERRKLMPASMDIRIPAIPQAPALKVVITEK